MSRMRTVRPSAVPDVRPCSGQRGADAVQRRLYSHHQDPSDSQGEQDGVVWGGGGGVAGRFQTRVN